MGRRGLKCQLWKQSCEQEGKKSLRTFSPQSLAKGPGPALWEWGSLGKEQGVLAQGRGRGKRQEVLPTSSGSRGIRSARPARYLGLGASGKGSSGRSGASPSGALGTQPSRSTPSALAPAGPPGGGPGERDRGPPRRREGGEGEGTGELAPACCAPGAHSRRRRSAGEGTASAPGATPVRPPELRRARAPGPENAARGTRIQVPDPRCAPGEERVPRPPCARPRAASAWTRAGSGPPAPAPRSRLGLPSPSGWGRGGCGAWRAHRSAALLLIRKCPPPTRLPAGPARPPARCRCRPPADRCSQPLARDSSARPAPRVPTPLSSLAFAPTPPPPPRHSAGFV
ncbi:hypothetical protein R6Z07F_015006 [Ovis aries]